MNSRFACKCAAAILGACFLLLPVKGDDLRAADKYEEMINCDLHSGSCIQPLGNHMLVLSVSPRPVKAMTDLMFEIVVKGDAKLTGLPFIDLGMPGMDMGKNQVTLTKRGEGTYTGAGVIVRCKSGRRTWRATVTVPGIGSAVFIFDVIY